MVIYLSPGDYHRFHSPAIHTASYRRHIAGYLSPVKPAYVNRHKDVFRHNERVNIFGRWNQNDDFFFTSFVGALNVGSILLDFDEEVRTNMAKPNAPYYSDKAYSESASKGPLKEYEKNLEHSSQGEISFEKGQMTGRFEMGSTIVLIFEAPRDSVSCKVAEGDAVTLGQEIYSKTARSSASPNCLLKWRKHTAPQNNNNPLGSKEKHNSFDFFHIVRTLVV